MLFRLVCGLVTNCMVKFFILMHESTLYDWLVYKTCALQVRTVADTVRLAQARCAETRPELPARVVAQATWVCFERAHNSPRREGSRLSEIPRCLLVPVEPSPRRKGTRLGETVSPERDPSA